MSDSTNIAASWSQDDAIAWQTAHDSTQALSDLYNANFDKATTDLQRAVLDKLADAASATLTILDQEEMATRTGAIDTAEGPLQGAINNLSQLKTELEAVSEGFEEASVVISSIDQVVGDVQALIKV